jgi:hypothetical protein
MTERTALDNPILAEHAAEIRRLGNRVIKDVIEIGQRLAESREILKEEGCWRSWLKDELGWSPQTAGRFIQVYELSGDVPRLEHLELPISAFYMLAAPSTPPDVRAEIIERAEAGEEITVAKTKTAITKRKPEPKPKPKHPKYDVNPAAAALFANEDQVHAFAGVVNTKAARRFITYDQQVELAKQLIEGNIRALHYQGWVTQWLRQAGKAQSEIDDEERDDTYKQMPGYEIKDEVDAAKHAAREFTASLVKLEMLWKKFPANPFFGEIGSALDGVINMIRQYRRAAGEKSSDETERKLARLRELEDKARRQESIIEALRSEVEELRAKLEAGGDMSISEFQTAIKKWEETVETQKNIIRDLQNENATLRAERERAR